MINYIKTKRVVFIFILIGVLLSMFVLDTPRPINSDVDNKFSAVRAQEHIKEISRKPHSYYDRDELDEVRVYIKNNLINYLKQENVKTYQYSVDDLLGVIPDRSIDKVKYPIENIMGVIPGKNVEGILLMAHYDSRGHAGRLGEQGRSYGAMDDGYGVATLLEFAYLLKDETPENSIYFLFTDAEEVGLFGAHMATTENEIMNNTKFLINYESRGQYGPAYMFETSNNNKKVIDLYKHAKLPVSYSMATAVYSVMPNFTDFTPFVEKGIPGMNFANLAGLDYYHSPLDSYENIDLSTIQHMGTQTEPIIREFINNDKYVKNDYFDAENDQVFFTLFKNILITYTQTAAIFLAVLLLIATILLFVVKYNDIKNIKETFLKGSILMFSILLFTYIFTMIIAYLGKTEFSITYVRIKEIDPIAFIFLTFVTIFLGFKLKNEKHYNNSLLIGIIINVILTIVTTIILPGASFLFSITSLFGIIAFIVKDFNNNLIKKVTFITSYIVMFLLMIPLIFSFYMALTIGGLTILVLLIMLNGIVTIPIIHNHLKMEE